MVITLFGGMINIDVNNFMTTNKKIPLQRELDFNYAAFVLGKTNNANTNTRKKWLKYDNILLELEYMGEMGLIDEIKYRITDNEEDKKVFKSVLKKIKSKSTKLNLLINSI